MINGTYILLGVCILSLVLLVLVIVLFIMVYGQKKLLSRFTAGNDGKSLEQDIIAIIEDNKFLKISADENKKAIRTLIKEQERSFQKMGVVKYDAFHQMGGQLSYCLCLLDNNNNGFIVNSVHSTEGCYSYIKEIRSGECAIDLGDEEEQALTIALEKKI